MKLIKCYVENFGNLYNFEYKFSDGLNIIKQDNGFGKTTLATFIKSMFYGLDVGTNVKTENSERKKYMPWQGGAYGGNIEFEINGKKYIIERFFGKKATDDTFKLYDFKTNLESNDYTENIGEEIFKINKSAYEKSTYIPQGKIQIKMDDSLNAKLGNILESENDINTSEEAIKRITENKKIYKKDRGKGGLIDSQKDKLYQLERNLENRNSDIEILENKKQKLEEKKLEIKQLENERIKQQRLLAEKMEQDRIKAKQEMYQTLVNKFQENEKSLENFNNFFANEVPDDDFLKNLETKNYDIEHINVEIDNSKLTDEENRNLENLRNKFDEKNITEDKINQGILEYSKLQELDSNLQKKLLEKENKQKIIDERKNRKFLIGILIIGLIFIIAGTGVNFLPMVVFGILAIVVFFVVRNSFKKNDYILVNEVRSLEMEIEELKSLQDSLNKNISDLLILTNSIDGDKLINLTNLKSDYNLYQELLNKQNGKNYFAKNALSRKNELEKELKNNLSKYFENLDKPYSELLQELKLKKKELENIKQQYEVSKMEKERYEKENDIDALNKQAENFDVSEEEMKAQINEFNKKFDVLVDEKNQLKNEIEFLENKIDDYEFVENDIENLEKEIESLEQKYNILDRALQLLKVAKETFSSSYLQDMIDGFNYYLKLINNADVKTTVDVNLGVKLEANGAKKEVKFFSTGYQDLVYICVRFSLIRALFKNELPIIVLDDPFVNLDENKTAKALKVVEEFSKEYQLIYFVCHSSRV